MKAIVVSDVHSNIFSLQAIMKKECDYDIIFCAGDLVDYGPCPCEVIDWVVEKDVKCVRGNHDKIAIELYEEIKKESYIADNNGTRWIDYNVRELTEKHYRVLKNIPEYLNFVFDGIEYIMIHRTKDRYRIIESLYEFDSFWKSKSNLNTGYERRIILGHTHRQGVYYMKEDALWLNPGSTSYRRPDDQGREAQYITITNGNIDLKELRYDLSLLVEIVRKIKLEKPEYNEINQFWVNQK